MPTQPTPIDEIISRRPYLYNLESEVILDLQLVPRTVLQGAQEINKVPVHLQLDDSPVPTTPIVSIPKESFLGLFTDACSWDDLSEAHITGLKIYHGLDDDLNFCPIFEPLFMWKLDEEDDESEFSFSNGYYYIFDNGSFRKATIQELSFPNNYRENIKIKRLGGGDEFSDFELGIDVEAVTFSFQTIFTLIHDNDDKAHVDICNSIRIVSSNNGDEVKHCLLLSPELPVPMIEVILTGKYANRGHLCPPDCSRGIFRLA